MGQIKNPEYRSNNSKLIDVNLSARFSDQFGLISYFMLLKAEKVMIASLVLLATKYGGYLKLKFHCLITTVQTQRLFLRYFCFLLVDWEGVEMCQPSSFTSMDPAYCPFLKV